MAQDKRQQKKAKTQQDAPAPVIAEDQQTIIMNALEIQEKIDENNEKLEQEIETLKQKYQKTSAPLIKKRSEQTKKIDQFWARVFVAHDVLSDLLTANDVEALTFCTDVQVDSNKTEENEVITVTMSFAQNPFFTNDKLTKTVTISEMDAEIAEQEDDEEFLAPNVQTEQSGIKWKDGKKFTTAPEDSDDEETEKKGKKAGEKRDREEADMDEEGSGFLSFFEGETVFDEDVIETLLTEIIPSPFEFFMSADDSDDDEDNDAMFAGMGEDSEEESEEEEAPAVVAVPVKQEKKQKPVKQEKAAPAKQEKPVKQEAPKKQEQKKAAPVKQEQKQEKKQQPKQEQKQGGNKQKQQGGKGQQQQQGGKKNKGKKGGK